MNVETVPRNSPSQQSQLAAEAMRGNLRLFCKLDSIVVIRKDFIRGSDDKGAVVVMI